MELLARAVKLAAKYREESFDRKASNKASHSNKLVDHDQFYRLTMGEAANKAAEEVGFDTRGTEPIYLLLQYCWNDILEWAKQFE